MLNEIKSYKATLILGFPFFYVGFVMESYIGFETILYRIFSGQFCLCRSAENFEIAFVFSKNIIQ
jgi:hypothetical protein